MGETIKHRNPELLALEGGEGDAKSQAGTF
jgi:hypothetical protein